MGVVSTITEEVPSVMVEVLSTLMEAALSVPTVEVMSVTVEVLSTLTE